jgi:hypothetical protein
MSDDLGPWPEKMYLLHPSLKSFGDRVTYPERREYVRADLVDPAAIREAALHEAAWCFNDDVGHPSKARGAILALIGETK